MFIAALFRLGRSPSITRNTGDAKLNTLTAPNTLNTTNPAFHAFENVSDSIASFSGPGGGGGRSKSISSSSSSTRARSGVRFLLLLVGLDLRRRDAVFPLEREKDVDATTEDDRDLDAFARRRRCRHADDGERRFASQTFLWSSPASVGKSEVIFCIL